MVVALVLAAAGCWRQPGFGPLRQGWNPVDGGLDAANVATLEEAWTAHVGDGGIRSDPVVSGVGYVHVSDERGAYAFRAATGQQVWRTDVVPADRPPQAQAGVVSSDETKVYVPWAGVPDDGGWVDLDARTGEVLRRVGGAIGTQSFVLRGPWRVSEFTGFVEGTLAGAGFTITGPVSWTQLIELGGSEPLRGPTSAAITADRFLVGLDQGFQGTNVLAGWDLTRGCDVFQTPDMCRPDVTTQLDGVPVTPVVDGDESTGYVATDAGTVYAVNTASGEVRWTAALGSPVLLRMAWTPEALYAVTTAGDLMAFDPNGCGGAVCPPTWTTALVGTPVTPPAVAGDVIYVASAGGTVEAFPADGPTGASPVWSTSLGSRVTGGPVVSRGTLFLATADGRLVAYRPVTPL